LDDEVVVVSSSCYKPVTGRNVANPFEIADTKGQLEADEILVVDKCVDGEVGSVVIYRRRVVVYENRRALRDRQRKSDVKLGGELDPLRRWLSYNGYSKHGEA
jgi:hypothetical protein